MIRLKEDRQELLNQISLIFKVKLKGEASEERVLTTYVAENRPQQTMKGYRKLKCFQYIKNPMGTLALNLSIVFLKNQSA